MQIAQATTSHLNGVASLFNDYRIFYKQPSDLNGANVFVKERLEKRDSVIFIAIKKEEDRDPLLGFTQLYPTFSSVSMKRMYVLNDLFVCADARGQGIGSALLKHAQEFAANEPHCKGLALETARDNFAAQKLYERLGFARDDAHFYYEWTVPVKPN